MDADLNDSPSTATGAGDGQSKSSDSTVDYKAKYIGQQKAYDRLNQTLQQKLDELANNLHAQHEQELSQLRIEAKTAQTRAQELDALHKAEKERADKAAAKAEKLEKRGEKRAELAEKYPILLELFDTDDLKDREQFADDESYTKYLDRQAARFGQVSQAQTQAQGQQQIFNPQQNSQFRVPATGATVRVNTNSGSRTEAIVKAEIQKTSPSKPEYWTLLDELEALKTK